MKNLERRDFDLAIRDYISVDGDTIVAGKCSTSTLNTPSFWLLLSLRSSQVAKDKAKARRICITSMTIALILMDIADYQMMRLRIRSIGGRDGRWTVLNDSKRPFVAAFLLFRIQIYKISGDQYKLFSIPNVGLG